MQKVLLPQIALDDLMLYDFASQTWTGVLQMGPKPEGRWNASIAYAEDTE
jgi:hypothetical protein